MLNFYIKTTETCNLNCHHCYTSGKNGRKIYFNPEKVANWVNQFADTNHAHFEFHGGEPFLAPLSDMWKFYELTKDVWENKSYGCTTNLVHKLTNEKLEFMDTVLEHRVATSWDPRIRFENQNQIDLFESNVKLLLDRGYNIRLFVTLTKDVVNMGPLALLEYVRDLGVQELSLERVTNDGHAIVNDVTPSNLELQYYFLEMHNTNTRDWVKNLFMESVYVKFENNYNSASTFCRDCEQKLFTINADGTIAGCPNTAPTMHYATLDTTKEEILSNSKRCNIIASELTRDPRCLSCNVYKYCNGDCHQLQWQGDICPAPKLLMRKLNEEYNGII